MKRIMLIGFGAMAKHVIAHLPANCKIAWVVAKTAHHADIKALLGNQVATLTSPAECQQTPDLVLECASQQAVAQFGSIVLMQGWRLAIISTGILANQEVAAHLQRAQNVGKGQLIVLSGAVAGMDGLRAAKMAGLSQVTYRSSKSPRSWQGSPAEKWIDLQQVSQATVFFQGSARQAASLFPANANVAATIAYYGLGMDETQVQLQVDPHTQQNSHFIDVKGEFGQFTIELNGHPLKSNPKTSTLAALSALEICQRIANDQY